MPVKLSTYLKKTYGEKVYRLSLSSGCGCPNRDGSICYDSKRDDYYIGEKVPGTQVITGGCSFCSEGGSGEFASIGTDIDAQINAAKELVCRKTDARKFIAYFQSYTNTYGDVDRLRKLYLRAISRDDIVALSIGTRPDCLGPEVLSMLKELQAIKPVWVELGLQTIHEATARQIRRGYKLQTFEESYRKLKEIGITVVIHVIFGLPGETPEDMLNTICYLSDISPVLDGIKIQNLQVIKGTDICRDYEERGEEAFHVMTMEEYTDLVAKAIALLPKETVVHRMTGDGPRRLLVAPLWSLDKKRVLNMLTKKTRDILE
ncbi:TIGR01212 family radical SAM protein [Butyrivibrio sp. AE2032]|uniref:TIGR01212 family radical SAM protein n=1 Tax=Butyrivibrio sp. AE2032 TaxID=1458463 RepID=UPI0005510F19|nr:TIGR01212 family radical SAM protein [Butyrivibrio sp. AE2032]